MGASSGDGIVNGGSSRALVAAPGVATVDEDPRGPGAMFSGTGELWPRPEGTPLVSFAIIADMNGRYGSAEYDSEVVRSIDEIVARRPDLVINAGDMVAGQRAGLNYRRMWAGFHATVTDRLTGAGIPMAQTPGNHDGSAYDRYRVERETYIDEWQNRRPDLAFADDSHYPLYYSFVKGGVLFISLDASTLEPLDDEQYAWLEGQLASNQTGRGAVVFGHVPLFPMTTIKPTEILRDDRLAGLYSRYGVQMVISGHQHAYFPAMRDGVMYLHSGAIGGGPRPVRQNDGVVLKTLTFVTLYANQRPYIDTLVVSGGSIRPVNHNMLPTYVVFGNEVLPRADLRPGDAEFARDHMISPHMSKGQMEALISVFKENGNDWGRIPDWR